MSIFFVHLLRKIVGNSHFLRRVQLRFQEENMILFVLYHFLKEFARTIVASFLANANRRVVFFQASSSS